MKYIELFAGIGGFRYGLDRTGHKCVWANEWLDKPRMIYNYNYGEMPDGRDIRVVRGKDLPEADLIVGGFPCATFSVAGKRSGFGISDARGTLCFEMFRIAQERNIPYLLFENVKGLLNHDSGKTFAVILCALDEMGYDCQWELLDTQNFGIPQHRERIFLIANIRGKPRPKVFPLRSSGEENDNSGYEAQGEGEGLREQNNKRFSTGTLMHRLYGGNTNNFYLDHESIYPRQRLQNAIRKLTAIECERLQGLPDNFTKWLKDENGNIKENNDSDRYERCGRTVTSTVIEAIGRKLGYEWY